MEINDDSIDSLLEKVEEYGKTKIDLLKLKWVDKASEIGSCLISRLLLLILTFLFIGILSIAVSFWLGEYLGKISYGFLLVSAFYAVIVLLLLFLRPVIKARIRNLIIQRILH